MIKIEITGHADEVQAELRALLYGQGGINATVAIAQVNEPAADTKAVANKPVSGRTREKDKAETAAKAAAEKAQQAISTGEERTDPEADKQDAADEKAETEAAKPDPIKLTHDDVKKLLGGYVMAYGMEAAQADGIGFIGAPKISEIPNTQAALAAAVLGIAKGINGNPHKRDLNGDGLSPEKTAELKIIVAAATAVK